MLTAAPFHSDQPSVQPIEEHILERLSSLEYETAKLNERISQSSDIVNKLVSGNFYDHKMIEAISEALQKARVVKGKTLENLWRERVLNYREESERRTHFAEKKKRILDLCPESKRQNTGARLNEAESMLFGNHPEGGVHRLLTLFRSEPGNYELAFVLSEHFYSNRQYAEAMQCLKKALKTNPQHFDSLLLFGVILTNSGRYAQAEAVLQHALKLQSDSHLVHLTLGAVCASQGRQFKAQRHLAKAVGLAHSSSMYFTAAEISANSGWNKEAIRYYKKAIQIDPTFDEAFYKLGIVYLKSRRARAAEKCLRTACQLNPQESRYREALKAHSKKQARQN